jgi:hypothetical protein
MTSFTKREGDLLAPHNGETVLAIYFPSAQQINLADVTLIKRRKIVALTSYLYGASACSKAN